MFSFFKRDAPSQECALEKREEEKERAGGRVNDEGSSISPINFSITGGGRWQQTKGSGEIEGDGEELKEQPLSIDPLFKGRSKGRQKKSSGRN